MNKSLRNDFLGTEGEFYWYMPNWLGTWICQIIRKHKDIDEDFGYMHCPRCSLCLYKNYFEGEHLLCPDCQMNSEQLEKYAKCVNDDCQQECING